MITVCILINGQPIYTRTAVNIGIFKDSICKYRVDDGSKLMHDRLDGAVILAKKLLDTIKEK